MKMQAKMQVEAYIFNANSYQGLGGIIFLLLARHWLVFFENHKISPTVILRRPGGMRGGAGGDMRGLEICRFEICNYERVVST